MSYQIKQNASFICLGRIVLEKISGGLHQDAKGNIYSSTAYIRGSQLSSRPDQSNDDVVFLVPRVIFNNGSSETGFGQENRHILHCHFRFKLIFRSRVVLGCCEACAETSLKSSSAINAIEWFEEMFQRWMRWSLDDISGSLVQQVISRHCSARLSAVKVWNIIKNRAYAAIVHGFSN